MSEHTPKVSVIVPVYNVEPYIRQCLDSLINQTLSDIELIVVDDGSPDNCPQIIDEYAAKDGRIRPIHKKNGGVSAARNDGLAAARGEYLHFVDSDDWLAEDALERMVSKAEETDSDVVIGDFYAAKGTEYTRQKMFDREFVTDDPATVRVIQNTVLPKGLTAFKSNVFSRGYCLGAPWHSLIRSSLVFEYHLTYDPYVKGMFDDGLFMLHVFEYANKVAYISTVTYFYRFVTGSITQKFNPNILAAYQRVYERLDQFGTEYKKGEDYDEAVRVRVIGYLNKSMSVYFMNSKNEKSEAERYQEFRQLLETQPYRNAIKQVKFNSIYSKKTKTLVFLLKMRMNKIYWRIKAQ